MNNSGLNGIERATLNANGEMGTLVTAPVTLVTARQGHTSVVIGRYLYVIGGVGNITLNSVERAMINADGSLGTFVTVSGVTMVTARSGHTSAVVGSYLYVLGNVGSIERATIAADSSLGSFTAVPISFVTARSLHTSVIIGSYLYILGGYTGASLNSVERATISPDGSLGAFMTAPVTLVTARHGHTSTIIGGYLYVVGGYNSTSGALNSVERATINADGSLGAFATVPSVTLTTARYYHASAVIGNYFYVTGSPVTSVTERALINADGSLGPFVTVSNVAIKRSSYTDVVIGNYLYEIAGNISGIGAVNSVERATLSADVP